MSDEKRRFSRFPFKMNGVLTVQENSYEIQEIENLSIGGCLLSVEEALKEGSPCNLEIILGSRGDGPVINVKAVIVRFEKGRVALKFTGIDPDSLFHLQKVAMYNASDSDKVEKEIDDHPGLV